MVSGLIRARRISAVGGRCLRRVCGVGASRPRLRREPFEGRVGMANRCGGSRHGRIRGLYQHGPGGLLRAKPGVMAGPARLGCRCRRLVLLPRCRQTESWGRRLSNLLRSTTICLRCRLTLSIREGWSDSRATAASQRFRSVALATPTPPVDSAPVCRSLCRRLRPSEELLSACLVD